MPKLRFLRSVLTSASLIAIGAGVHAGWIQLSKYPGGPAGALQAGWRDGWQSVRAVFAPPPLGRPAPNAQPEQRPALAAVKAPPANAKVVAAIGSDPPTASVRTPDDRPAAAPEADIERAIAAAAAIPGPSLTPVLGALAPAPRPEPLSAQPTMVNVGVKLSMRAVGPPASAAPPSIAPPDALGAISAITSAPRAVGALAGQPNLAQTMLAAYAPLPDMQAELDRLQGNAARMPIDAAGVKEAIAAYRAGDIAKGDEFAKTATNEVARTAIEWALLRLQPRPAGFSRIEAFLTTHPDWPMADWLRTRAEQAIYVDKPTAARIAAWLDNNKPASPTGTVLLARRLVGAGKEKEAAAIIARTWREDDNGAWAEGVIYKEFSKLLTASDHRWRSDRLFYKEKYPASLAAAAKAGKEYSAFAAARANVARGADPAKAGAKIDAKLRKEPTWQFAQVARLRKAKKFEEAAKLLLAAPHDGHSNVSPAEWWEERRIIARKRLDDGKAQEAYAIVSQHGASTGENFIAAEFHAGWIALRFLDKPDVALGHFSAAMEVATTPLSRSRAAYWQARAAERGPEPDDADRLYAIAAEYSSTYYGQLARERLGRKTLPIRTAATVADGDARALAVRVVEVLEALDEKDLALSLAVGMGRTLTDKSQLAALGIVLAQAKDARASLVVGKLASYRGIELDDIAFPTFGVPNFAPLDNSAARPVVYAIARQESAFQAKVVSHAGAKGLMQMLTSTAQRTAKNRKVPFDPNRLVNDPAFNAQLGAAHLGELMGEHPGSLIMVFAAYNAGGHRVKQWVQAYGDPRKPDVDPIDWVERIPFTETRNYVQRVAENLGIYRARMKELQVPSVAESDLRAYAARM